MEKDARPTAPARSHRTDRGKTNKKNNNKQKTKKREEKEEEKGKKMKKRERLFCHVLFYCSLLAIESAELLRGAIAELYRWLGTARMSSSSELPPVPLPVPVPFSGWLFFFSFFGLWFSAIYRMKHHFIFCYSSLGWLNAGRQSHFSSRLSSIALSSSSANHDDHSLIRVSCMRFRLKVYLFTSLPVYNLNNQLGKQNR